MSYWKLYYHITWSTKGRLSLIDSALKPALYRVIAAKVQEMGGTLHAIGGTADHIHLAVSVPPKVSLAKFIGDVKGNSSHFINFVVKPDFEFHWQDEYGILSFREKDLPGVIKYINNQKQHHADGSVVALIEYDDNSPCPPGDKPPG